MRILLTGGSGFIGSHFINAASKQGHDLICLRRNNSKPITKLKNKVTWVTCNLILIGDSVICNVDALVHLSAAGVSPQKASRTEMLS